MLWSGWPFLTLHWGIFPLTLGSNLESPLQVGSWLSSGPSQGYSAEVQEMVRGWMQDCRRVGWRRCSQLVHLPQPLLYFLPASIFITTFSFSAVLEIVAGLCGGASTCSWQFQQWKYIMDSVYLTNKFAHIFSYFCIRFLVGLCFWCVFLRTWPILKIFKLSNTESYHIFLLLGRSTMMIYFVVVLFNVFPFFFFLIGCWKIITLMFF